MAIFSSNNEINKSSTKIEFTCKDFSDGAGLENLGIKASFSLLLKQFDGENVPMTKRSSIWPTVFFVNILSLRSANKSD